LKQPALYYVAKAWLWIVGGSAAGFVLFLSIALLRAVIVAANGGSEMAQAVLGWLVGIGILGTAFMALDYVERHQ
jgi:hypothetical protein